MYPALVIDIVCLPIPILNNVHTLHYIYQYPVMYTTMNIYLCICQGPEMCIHVHLCISPGSSYGFVWSAASLVVSYDSDDCWPDDIDRVTTFPGQYNPVVLFITSPPEGVARYCFHPVCLSVCVCVCLSVYLCVRPIFWYFISRLLEEISIWNLYRILIGLYSIH